MQFGLRGVQYSVVYTCTAQVQLVSVTSPDKITTRLTVLSYHPLTRWFNSRGWRGTHSVYYLFTAQGHVLDSTKIPYQ